MATVSRSTKVSGGTVLVSNTTARAADVEVDMLTLFNAHNNHNSGTSKWSVVSAEGATDIPLVVNNSTGTQNIVNFRDNGTNVLTVADGGTTTVTANGGTNKGLVVNNSTSTGNILEAQDNGSAVLTVADGGLTTASSLSATTASFTTVTTLGHSSMRYRRPILQWGSATTVAVESGLDGTSGNIPILFGDGTLRTETSTTRTTFNITRNAVLTTSGAQSGLRASLSEATNTWYALYAVKVTDSSTQWVTVGDTRLPLQANYADLNTAFGTNGWVYLGLIRNGDNGGATGDILKFIMSGNKTIFINELSTASTGMTVSATEGGTIVAVTGGATTLAYTYSAGTGTTNIPANIGIVTYHYGVLAAGAGAIHILDGGAAHMMRRYSGASLEQYGEIETSATDGLFITTSAGGSTKFYIALRTFTDNALGVCANPLI